MGNPLEPVLYPAQGTKGPILYLNPYSGTYTANRAYGLRMQRGYAAGLPQQVARRYGPGGTAPRVSESEQRRERFIEKYGYDQRVWNRLYRRYIKQIHELDPSVSLDRWRQIVSEVLSNTNITGLGADWLELRFAQKLNDMLRYRHRDEAIVIVPMDEYSYYEDEDARSQTPIELWWYH